MCMCVCTGNEDNLLIASTMPVGRLGRELRWLDMENNNADNNYMQYSWFQLQLLSAYEIISPETKIAQN